MKTLNEELENVKEDDTIIGANPPKIRTMFDVVKTGNYTLDEFKKSKELVAPEFESDINVRVREGISRGLQDIKNVPQGVEIFGGQVEMKIGGWAGSEETVERGRNLIKTAIDELDAKEKKYYQSAIPMSSKDYESLSFGVGQGITNYGAMLATGYLGGAVAGIGSMAVLEGTQKAQEKIGYYTEKTGDKELKGYTPEQAGKDVALTAIYTVGSAIMEKKLGYGAQRKLFKMPVGEKIKNVVLTGLSEGGTETLQELYATGIDFVGGYIDSSKLPERFLGAVQEGVIGGILGGTAGIAAAVNHRSQAKQILRENLQNTVPQKDLENVVNAVYESTSDSMANIITQELAQSEQLRNKHGAIYESLKSEVARQIQDNGAYSDVDEMKLSQYIEGTAKMFADQVLGEANNRGVVIDDVLKSSEIVYKDGRLYLQGATQETKLKRLKEKKKRETKTPSMLQFIRLNGGIRDDGGELKNMDAGKQFIGLVNKNGVDVDEMGEKLWESGYFMQRPTPAEVLDFIDDELKGIKHYPLGYVKQEGITQDENEARLDDAISEYADIMGYDLSKMSYDEKTEIYAQMQKNLFADETQEVEPEETEDFAFADNEFFQVADENARLDDIYPEYKGETITINGQEKTVYNSNGDRIAKSKEALENFYKWFGDSKVVDEQGRPLVVYHGTSDKFDVFLKEKRGELTGAKSAKEGFWFTDGKYTAESYAKYSAENSGIKKLEKQQRIAENQGNWDEYDRLTEEIEKLALDGTEKEPIVMPVYLKAENVNTFDAKNQTFMNIQDKINSLLEKSDNKDGLIIYNLKDAVENIDKEAATHIMVREPNQIKSTSNRGTYSESENIYYQFAGERAKTAALNELNRAKQLEADGVDNEEIRQQTGWFKGADGKWRFEISDKDAVLNEGFATKGSKIFMSALLEHEKLYEAYPELGSVLVEFIDDANVDYSGRHIPETFLQDESIIINLANVDKGRIKSVLMHEIQHAIQDTENFASGGSPETVTQEIRDIADSLHYKKLGEFEEISDKANRLADVLEVYRFSENPDTILKSHVLYEHGSPFSMPSKKDKKARKEYRDFLYDTWWQDMQEKYESRNDWEFFDLVRDGNVKEIKKQYYSLRAKAKRLLDKADTKALRAYEKLINDIDNGNISSMDAYRRLYGEVEARNTQSRMDLTEEQRKATTPESTQDVANADAIVIFDGKPMAYIPETYNQIKNLPKQKGKIKGAFDALTKSIEITSEADFSTYQHEFAHFWLDNMWEYVQSGKASESYKKQFEELNKWLDVKPNQRYYTREQTEKFARGYEKFLYEGKFPNPTIGAVFNDYREFIKEVYESAEEIDIRAGEEYQPLSQEARNFFNTMITGKTAEQLAEKPVEEAPEKPAEEKTEKTTEEKEEVKPRGLAKTTAEMAKEKGIEVEKPTYEVRKQTEMAKKADEFIKENKQLAIDIVKGLAPEQDGIFRQDLFAALREIALNEGDSDLLNDLSRSMTVEEATELGQRIQALARGRINPVKEMVELRDDRMKKNKVTKEKIKEETKKATKEINREIALAAEPKEWQEFIKSLEC